MRKEYVVMSDKLDVKGWTAEALFILMWKNKMFANRCYQRKLVWDLQENQLFIDSLLNKYPVPSIILSEYEVENAGDIDENYEIIDGLQRLNAIALFMQGKFPIEYNGEFMYYDLHYCPGAENLTANQQSQQEKTVLPFDICNDLRYAQIPVVITMQRNERLEKIELIFNRINSQGRKLSAHDIRQANNIGPFADLVRRVATIVRGDYTYDDRIDILDMPKISLRSQGLLYGIDPKSSFWIRHKFFQFSNFRQSKDEELLAITLAMCLLGDGFRVNTRNLDALYDSESELSKKVTESIEQFGKLKLEKEFSDIIIEIDNIFASVDSNFSEYLFDNAKTANKDICFSVLFYALYSLRRKKFVMLDYVDGAKTLKKNCDSTFSLLVSDGSHERKQKVIGVLCATLQEVMTKQLPRQRTKDDELLEELLSLSPVELQIVDFKIGLTYFRNNEWNDIEIEKIGKTLVAMANTNYKQYANGYVIVGVADNEKTYNDWKVIYGQKAVKYGRHFVTGIQAEACKIYQNVDEFVRVFSDKLKKLAISPDLLGYVLENMRVVDFHGKDLLLLPVQYTGNSQYENELYRREFSKTVKVTRN